MDMIYNLLYGKDPTKDWQEDRSLIPEVDLSEHALCGVKLKEPNEKLSFLGRADNRKTVSNNFFDYYSKGLQIGCEKGLIDSFTLHFNDKELHPEFSSFTGNIIYEGNIISLIDKTTEEEFITIFKEPYWRSKDEDEIILFYEFGEIEWQVEFDHSNRLKVILILTPPMFADQKHRETYQVTKPWPFL